MDKKQNSFYVFASGDQIKIALERTSMVIVIWKSRSLYCCFFAPILNDYLLF